MRSPERLWVFMPMPQQETPHAVWRNPRARLKTKDRFFWLVVRRLCPDCKRHLVLVRPEPLLGAKVNLQGLVGLLPSYDLKRLLESTPLPAS
jgi:hypothetical protein